MAVTHTRFGFKTGYLQKTDAYDVAVVSNEEGDVFKVGQLVTLTAAAGNVPTGKGDTAAVICPGAGIQALRLL